MTTKNRKRLFAGLALGGLLAAGTAGASSHMDAPLITLDPAANTTDVYAFVAERDGEKTLVTALGVYPFEEPGIGPNRYNFDDNVLYSINVALGDDVAAGRSTLTYEFEFTTETRNSNTILQSYLGVINQTADSAQNLVQNYRVHRYDARTGERRFLGQGLVPPNNQGIVTPFYNQNDDGEQPAKDGVADENDLDRYTRQTIADLDLGYRAFAGQRDDGFYADIQAVFDILSLRSPGQDSQGGFNIHTMALEIPMAELGGDQQIVGVYTTTSRRRFKILSPNPALFPDRDLGPWVQVGRQGNPLFAEGFVAIADKDAYNRTPPTTDSTLFATYAETPELAALLNALVVPGSGLAPAAETGRTDIAGIYIPDLIKVDLSTPAARLAGSGPNHPTNPDDDGFSRLSIFGDDLLQSQIQDPFANGGFIPGGWPNGRRFGDDVLDIGVSALLSDLRTLPLFIQVAGDNVDSNDIGYNKVFPYASTPLNGRTHSHP